MPRLLIVCEYPTLFGGERSMLATLPAVQAAGFDIHIAAPFSGPLADAIHGISHPTWETHDDSGQRLPLEKLRDALAKIIRGVTPDLVHANSLSAARIAGPVAADHGVRSIGHLRDIIKLTGQAIDDLNRHCRLLAVSQATRDFHVQQGLDAAKSFVLNNGVDLTEFRPQQPTGYLHRELSLPSGAHLIAVIGQIGLRKGTEVALTAALQIADRDPHVHWLIVGKRTSHKPESHEFEAQLHSLANRPPLAGRVHFIGVRADIPQLLNECDLLVHAARQEPLGRVLLESAASGLAVIATDVGGTREIFPTENDGAILVPPDDTQALTIAIELLLGDTPRRRALGAAARRRAESAFNIQTAAARLIDHYHQVLND